MSLGGRSTSNCWLWRTRISVCILFVRRAPPEKLDFVVVGLRATLRNRCWFGSFIFGRFARHLAL